jgi:hypothetical protein
MERVGHQGQWLRLQIERSRQANAAFARRAGVAREVLQRWFNDVELHMRPAMMWRVLEALGLDKIAGIMGNVRKPETLKLAADRSVIETLTDYYDVPAIIDTLMQLDLRGELSVPGATAAKKRFDESILHRGEVARVAMLTISLPIDAHDRLRRAALSAREPDIEAYAAELLVRALDEKPRLRIAAMKPPRHPKKKQN